MDLLIKPLFPKYRWNQSSLAIIWKYIRDRWEKLMHIVNVRDFPKLENLHHQCTRPFLLLTVTVYLDYLNVALLQDGIFFSWPSRFPGLTLCDFFYEVSLDIVCICHFCLRFSQNCVQGLPKQSQTSKANVKVKKFRIHICQITTGVHIEHS